MKKRRLRKWVKVALVYMIGLSVVYFLSLFRGFQKGGNYMKKLINNINEYLEVTVQTKKNMKERIYQLEKDVKEARDNEKYALEQMNKYKKKLHEEKKKIKTGKI